MLYRQSGFLLAHVLRKASFQQLAPKGRVFFGDRRNLCCQWLKRLKKEKTNFFFVPRRVLIIVLLEVLGMGLAKDQLRQHTKSTYPFEGGLVNGERNNDVLPVTCLHFKTDLI